MCRSGRIRYQYQARSCLQILIQCTARTAIPAPQPSAHFPLSFYAGASGVLGCETLDFDLLTRKHREARQAKDRQAAAAALTAEVEAKAAELEKSAPNLKAVEQYDAIREEEKKQVGAGVAVVGWQGLMPCAHRFGVMWFGGGRRLSVRGGFGTSWCMEVTTAELERRLHPI